MLIVETIAKIRRAYFVQGRAIKAICRELRVSRKSLVLSPPLAPAAQWCARMTVLSTICTASFPLPAAKASSIRSHKPLAVQRRYCRCTAGIVVAFLIARLKESPLFLAASGRQKEAEKEVTRLEAIAQAEHGALAPPVLSDTVLEARRVPYRQLFRQGHRGRVALFCTFWVLQTFGIYAFSASVPLLLVKEGFSVINTLTYSTIMTIASPLGAFLAIFLSERVSRKWLLVIAAFIIPAIILFGFITSCLTHFFAAILYIYTPESFPTGIRSSGMRFYLRVWAARQRGRTFCGGGNLHQLRLHERIRLHCLLLEHFGIASCPIRPPSGAVRRVRFGCSSCDTGPRTLSSKVT